MKITIFTDVFLPHVNGVVSSLVHLIAEYEKKGHEVLVVAPKTQGTKEVSIHGVKIVFLPSIPSMVYPELAFGFFSPQLLLALKKFSPDIIHITAPGPIGNIGIFYAKLRNIKSIATFHTYFMESEYLRIVGIKERGVKLAQKVLWKFTKTFYDRADAVITPSLFVKKDLQKHRFARKITVIKNAVNFSKIKKDEKAHEKFINKYNLKDKKVVVYIGRISLEKNISFLIEIFPEVLKQVENAHLLIVGHGPDRERLEDIVKNLGIEKNVTFTGKIENSQLVKQDVFGVGKVFATGSHSEVQPMSIIEAMNFGLPIVAIKSRGLGEMINNNGFLIDGENKKSFVNALVKVLTNLKLQKRLSQKSLELAETYSVEHSAAQHIKLYKKLTKKTKNNSVIRKIFKRS